MYERFLLQLDVGPVGAALRLALGLVFALAWCAAFPRTSWPAAVGALALALFAVKASTAVARRAVGATARVQASWEWRRNLARLHDAYQIRKLLWVGAGILLGSWSCSAAPAPAPWVGAACVAAGAAAEAWWRRQGLALEPQERK